MKLFRLLVLGLLLSTLAIEASAQVVKGKDKGKTSAAATASVLTDPLFPTDLIARLKLDTKQKSEAAVIFKEFNSKLKEIASKAGSDPDPAPAPPPKGKGKGKGKGGPAMSPGFAAALDLRDKYEEQFEGLLTVSQKKILDDIRAKQGEALLNPKK